MAKTVQDKLVEVTLGDLLDLKEYVVGMRVQINDPRHHPTLYWTMPASQYERWRKIKSITQNFLGTKTIVWLNYIKEAGDRYSYLSTVDSYIRITQVQLKESDWLRAQHRKAIGRFKKGHTYAYRQEVEFVEVIEAGKVPTKKQIAYYGPDIPTGAKAALKGNRYVFKKENGWFVIFPESALKAFL